MRKTAAVSTQSGDARKLCAALLAPLLFGISLATEAAVVETIGTTWGGACCEAVFETRYGNNAANGDWEVAGDAGGVPDQRQLTYTDGGTKNFSLTQSAATGDLTFMIDGLATPIVLDLPGPDATAPNGYGWQTIGLMISSKSGNGFNATLSNVVLSANAGNANYSLPLLVAGSGSEKTQSVLLAEDVYGFFYDFTLTGELTFEWGNGRIKVDDLDFMVGVANQVPVPVPAAFWLFGSALGLMVVRRRA